MDVNEAPIEVEHVYNASAAAVWHAITDKDQMQQWFFESVGDFEPIVGSESSFNVHHDGQDYLHQWRVIEVVPEKKIAYGWKYQGIPGDSLVTWELSDTPDGTSLKLTHLVLESFPSDNPVFKREAGQSGWEYLLHESLKAFLQRKS